MATHLSSGAEGLFKETADGNFAPYPEWSTDKVSRSGSNGGMLPHHGCLPCYVQQRHLYPYRPRTQRSHIQFSLKSNIEQQVRSQEW